MLASLAGAPVLGAVLSPLLRREVKTDQEGFLPAIALAELEVGVPKRVDLVSTRVDGWARSVGVIGSIWLLKREDGSVTGLSSVCPHSGCTISLASRDRYSCPCLTSSFALDGKSLEGPSPRARDPLQLEVRDKVVFCRHARFRQGQTAREEI